MSIFAIFRSFAFFRNPLFYRERTRNTRNTRKSYVHFRSLSRFRIFRNHIFIAKGRGKREIREKHMSIFAFCSLFCNFSRNYYYRERTRNTRNTRKTYITFRSLSLFRFFSQFYILSRKDAENAKYAKTYILFAAFRSFAFFRNHIFIAKERGKCEIRGNIYTFRIIFDFSRFFAIGTTLADYY